MKKVLIIGGSSSICDGIVDYLEKNDHEIDLMTYRNEQNKKNIKNFEKYKWVHLDLLSQESTEKIIFELPDFYYDKIICVPTYPSGQREPLKTTRLFWEELFGKFIINYMDLIRNLIFKKLKNDGHFVFMSSEAANSITDMHDYSAAKATIQSYVRSLSKKSKNKTIFVIATTGIYKSLSYYNHGEDYYKHDPDRWVMKEDIAKIIVEADKMDNGNIFTLGFCPLKTEIIDRYSGILYPYNYTEGSYNYWHKIVNPHDRPEDVIDILGDRPL